MAKRKFEARIINPILNIIKNNIDYLTRDENLGQLAKLGYMYETLYYAGRRCYGYEGIIKNENQCENNPKYKLEMCDVGTEEQYDLIYDAWGMHIKEGVVPESFEEFRDIILGGKIYSELELKQRKPNKTLDEWLEIWMDNEYRYKSLFPNRKRCLDYLLCTIGTGYGYKNGYIIQEASGADQDIAIYGEWENTILIPKFQKIIDKILNDEDVALVLNTKRQAYLDYVNKKKEEDSELFKSIRESLDFEEDTSIDELLEKLMNKRGVIKDKKSEYRTYYHICEYSKITMLDKDSHPSYVLGAIEICQDILNHIDEERNQQHPNKNIEFAEEFLNKEFIQQYL